MTKESLKPPITYQNCNDCEAIWLAGVDIQIISNAKALLNVYCHKYIQVQMDIITIFLLC